MAHTFIPHTREVETGRNMARPGRKEDYKATGDRISEHSIRELVETGYPICSEDFLEVRTSGSLFFFSYLSVFTP